MTVSLSNSRLPKFLLHAKEISRIFYPRVQEHPHMKFLIWLQKHWFGPKCQEEVAVNDYGKEQVQMITK